MATSAEMVFLRFSRGKLAQLAARIEDCLGRLSEEEIWLRPNPQLNAAGNLVLHLCGNVRQWIGHGAAGLPDVRKRDAEFAARGGVTRQELLERLGATMREADAILAELPAERLLAEVTLQGYRVTVLEAIYHAVEHFSQHVGQIIYLTKLLRGEDLGYYRHLSQKGERTDPLP